MSEEQKPQPLSDREREILALLATGATNQEIARALHISPNTVKVHLRNIYAKLGVMNRSEAIMVGLQRGYITLPGVPASQEEHEPRQTTVDLPSFPVGTPGLAGFLLGSLFLGLVMVLLLALWPAWWSTQARPLPRDTAFSDLNAPTSGLPSRRPVERWAPLTPLTTPRSRMAVAVWQGKVYIFGGEGPEGVVGTAAVFDPQRGVWGAIAAKPTPVSNAHAAVLGNRIYVFGGLDARYRPTDIIEIYDPVQDAWQEGGRLPHPLAGYALAVWEDRIYLFGGWDGEHYSSAVYAFDPKTGTWTLLPPMESPRAFAATAVLNGIVYVLGGFDGRVDLAEVWAFDPTAADSGTTPWSALPPMLDARGGAWATAIGQNLYVFGGGMTTPVEGAERFDPTTHTWARLETPYGPNWRHMGGAVVGDYVLLIGGWAGAHLPFVEQYQASFRSFIPFGPVNSP